MSYYDDEIENGISEQISSGEIVVTPSATQCFDRLKVLLKIPDVYDNVYQIPWAIVEDIGSESLFKEYVMFLEKNLGNGYEKLNYIYFGDDLTEKSYTLFGISSKFISLVSDIPQNHFLMSLDENFIILFSFENSMVYLELR